MSWGDPGEWMWLGLPLFIVSLWLTIFFVAARWGGWVRLAEFYPATGEAQGKRFRMRSAQLRAGCNYNNCVTFEAAPAGLRMSMPLPFRFEHPPVFIPWSELQIHESRTWWVPVLVFTPQRCPEVPIKIQRRLAQRLLESAPPR